jgi:hypothetical protein
MAKRYIERPTARQIVDRATREAAYERSLDVNDGWLAANYGGRPLPEAPRRPKGEVSTFHNEIAAFQREIDRLDNDNHQPDCTGVTPGLVRISNAKEPKSIHSPAPAGRLQFERPAKRKIGERNDRHCELPADPRRKRTVTVVDGDGVARGVIGINPFAKRVALAGFGLRQRAPVRKPKP